MIIFTIIIAIVVFAMRICHVPSHHVLLSQNAIVLHHDDDIIRICRSKLYSDEIFKMQNGLGLHRRSLASNFSNSQQNSFEIRRLDFLERATGGGGASESTPKYGAKVPVYGWKLYITLDESRWKIFEYEISEANTYQFLKISEKKYSLDTFELDIFSSNTIASDICLGQKW